MPLYTVFAPPPQPGETAPDPLRFVFVKDGFCWPALFVPELWLLFRRMWLVFVLYLAASVVLSVIGSKVGGPLPWVALGLMHLLFALEGNGLRRWKLSGHGYALIGVAEGRRNEAELRFFSQWQPPATASAAPGETPAGAETGRELPPAAPPQAAEAAPVVSTTPQPERDSSERGDVVGLFPAPGGTP
jgi:hypothetical protein